MHLKLLYHTTLLLGALSFFVSLPALAGAEGGQERITRETGFYYTVQKGDTLWDLSGKFFDSPFYWPALWGKNSQLPNPHLIYPGQRIRLHLRKERHTTHHTPEGPQTETIQVHYHYPMIEHIGFIRKKALVPSGHIFKVKDSKVMISQGDTVYIAPNGEAPLPAGTKFYVYRTFSPIRDRRHKTVTGIQHYFVGTIDILKNGDGYTLATVDRSYHNIKINDLVIPFTERSPHIPLTASVAGFDGSIIMAEDNNAICGDGTIVFVNKGTENGIKRGQMYSIYYREQEKLHPGDKKAVWLAPVDIGTILILHTEQATATALITRTHQNIYPGAMLRTPE